MTSPPDVVVVSGHMVDTPDRPQPRFPAEQVPRVAEEVRDALARWSVGKGTTLVTGGARGADILAAEEARARGAALRLVLALEPVEFVSRSVALPGTDWEERFRRLLGQAEVEVVDGPDDEDVFARTNRRIVEVARAIDRNPHAVIVWDGKEGDGPGGTRDFVSQLGHDLEDDHVAVIDPTP
jgi:PAS domain-containing protein